MTKNFVEFGKPAKIWAIVFNKYICEISLEELNLMLMDQKE